MWSNNKMWKNNKTDSEVNGLPAHTILEALLKVKCVDFIFYNFRLVCCARPFQRLHPPVRWCVWFRDHAREAPNGPRFLCPWADWITCWGKWSTHQDPVEGLRFLGWAEGIFDGRHVIDNSTELHSDWSLTSDAARKGLHVGPPTQGCSGDVMDVWWGRSKEWLYTHRGDCNSHPIKII